MGDGADVVDEQLWGDDQDKPEESSKAEEKYEKDAPVQVRKHGRYYMLPLSRIASVTRACITPRVLFCSNTPAFDVRGFVALEL